MKNLFLNGQFVIDHAVNILLDKGLQIVRHRLNAFRLNAVFEIVTYVSVADGIL